MYRRSTDRTLAMYGVGLLLAMGSLWMLLLDTPAQARTQELPPRPTLTPPGSPVHRSDNHTPHPSGRITGTIIDLTTGAPAPGIVVAVGDGNATTDANGNYDRTNLPQGDYMLALVLNEQQGIAAQEPITVTLAPGATIVQHLAFRSQLSLGPAPAPTAEPVVA